MEPSVRYIVAEVAPAVAFYERLGFESASPASEGFAMMRGHGLRLLLNAPGVGGAGMRADDGAVPESGGWNRIQVEVADIADALDELIEAGARIRTSATEGRGGSQAVLEDPSGNPVELFVPRSENSGENS